MAITDNVERQLFDWAFGANLGLIVDYHNFIRAKLHEHYHRDGVEGLERETLMRYDQVNANNCFLMAYAHLEEVLYGVWRAFAPNAVPSGTSSVQRFKPALVAAGVDLGSSPAWAFIVSASLVRDCLLHANGRVSHVRKSRDLLLKHVGDREDLMLAQDRLGVTSAYLKVFVEQVGDLQRAAAQV
jgi:hypothetical protein